jgi:hypothetical protein
MRSGFDAAWCRVSPALATPNEAVPLPAWTGLVTRQGSNSGRQIYWHPGGQICPIPAWDIYHHLRTLPRRPQYPVPPRCVLARAKPGKGPCIMTGISDRIRFSSITGNGAAPRFTPPTLTLGWQQGELQWHKTPQEPGPPPPARPLW